MLILERFQLVPLKCLINFYFHGLHVQTAYDLQDVHASDYIHAYVHVHVHASNYVHTYAHVHAHVHVQAHVVGASIRFRVGVHGYFHFDDDMFIEN